MKASLKVLFLSAWLAGVAGVALAKLPASSDEAKAKAAETKARADWNGKVAAFKLCKAQDKVVAYYKKAPDPKLAKAPAKGTAPTASAGACADPGPFVYTPNTAAAPAAPAPAAPAAVAAAKKP